MHTDTASYSGGVLEGTMQLNRSMTYAPFWIAAVLTLFVAGTATAEPTDPVTGNPIIKPRTY